MNITILKNFQKHSCSFLLGIAGVAGNGQSDLLNILGGIEAADSGEVIMKGESIDLTQKASAAMRRERGIGHVPEDR